MRIVALTVTLAAAALGEVPASPTWDVVSYVITDESICADTSVELLLQSATSGTLARHMVGFVGMDKRTEWPVQVPPGTYTVQAWRTDCAGIETLATELTTDITSSQVRKELYVAVVIKDGAFDLRFLSIATYVDGDNIIAVRRDGRDIVVTNLIPQSIQLCRDDYVDTLRREYRLAGNWVSFSNVASYILSSDVVAIEPQRHVIFGLDDRKRYVPPYPYAERPDAIRITLAATPHHLSHVTLGPLPRGFGRYPRSCDYLVVEQPLEENEELWLREHNLQP